MPLLSQLKDAVRGNRNPAELSPDRLDGFKRSQALAYQAATETEKALREGITEREVCTHMRTYLADHGVREYFHTPFAWFGDRTAFRGFRTDMDFLPTRKRLEPGMPVILDVAPIVEGHASDIGYACRLGDNEKHERMLGDLAIFRTAILEGVRAGKHLSAIYREVDGIIAGQGHDNRHRRYPFRVLAHRVNYVPPRQRTRLNLVAFGVPALSYLGARLGSMGLGGRSPFWNDRRSSDHTADPGLWAVEPHIGNGEVGVKWEELLVVTEHDAYWLDDDLPHVRRFGKRPPQPGAVATG